VCPATTDAITVAIVIGEARISPWPIMSAALVVSDSGGTTLPKYAGKPRSWSTPMPRVAAASTRSPPPSSVRSLMKAVLQELARADARVIRPRADGG
jgi:hypothetical protein